MSCWLRLTLPAFAVTRTDDEDGLLQMHQLRAPDAATSRQQSSPRVLGEIQDGHIPQPALTNLDTHRGQRGTVEMKLLLVCVDKICAELEGVGVWE